MYVVEVYLNIVHDECLSTFRKGKKNVITDTFIDLTDVVLKNNAIDTIFMSPHSTLFIKDICGI